MEESAVDRVVRLSTVTVGHYDRHSKSGRVQHVDSYQRHQKSGIGNSLKGIFHFAPSPTLPSPRPPDYETTLPPEDQANLARVRRGLKEAQRRGLDSMSQYYRYTGQKDHWGQQVAAWTPERAALHRQIIGDVLARAAANGVPKDRQAVMSGGPPGSGKTTTLASPESGIDISKYVSLSPDDMKEELIKRGGSPKVDGLSPMETVSLIHEESFDLANRLSDIAQEQGYNVNWDLSMSSEHQISKRLKQLKENGYQTTGIFVAIPVEQSVARSLARYKSGVQDYEQGKGYGGRFIDPNIIRKSRSFDPRYLSANERAFDAEAKYFDDWKMFDNSGDHPVLVGSKQLGLSPARNPEYADLPAGSIRPWNGVNYRKTKAGKWERVVSSLDKVKKWLGV